MQLANTAGSAAPPLTPAAPSEASTTKTTALFSNLSLLRNLKIGTFHIGSALADILANGVWNRVMIQELGYAATPVALLLALRYFLAPLSVWVGRRSDKRAIFGYHRLPYVWGGRLMMVASYVLLGGSTLLLARGYDPFVEIFSLGTMNITVTVNHSDPLGWLGVVAALLLFSLGSTFSGTTFLSLLYDRTPKTQRTRAVSVVWMFLIIGFAVAGIFYSRLLPDFTREGFLSLFLIAPLFMAGIWFFAVVGEEKPAQKGSYREGAESAPDTLPFWGEMRRVLASKQTRLFFIFLAFGNLFFYIQDVILEPFAGKVFGMPLATTNRFSTYWGSLALIGIVVSLVLARRYPKRVTNMALSRWGVAVLLITFALFIVCAVFQIRPLVTINLIVMGIGLGMWTVGSLGLMMDMTRVWGAGLYLALWTVSSTLARGMGVALGGIILDVALALTGERAPLAYGAVFAAQTVGFGVTLAILSRISVGEFEREVPSTEAVLAGSLD
ncbi:MAG TPA: BCD family MFS transporter [Aggregatilineales bacterium]|nr:BCD family MFS transporter [Anaerolineales bacterium]HRE47904.1 BCD family MFS transporter [Aggregatilineales bacterium]